MNRLPNTQASARQSLAYCDTLGPRDAGREVTLVAELFDACGYCLDAPEFIPAGAHYRGVVIPGSHQRVTARD